MTYNNDFFFVNQNGRTRLIKYHENEKAWCFHDEDVKGKYRESEDPFFTQWTFRHRRGNNLGKICSTAVDEPYEAVLKNGHLRMTESQFKMDKYLNSADGLDFIHSRELNDNWTLLNVNIKSTRIIKNRTVGSKIEVGLKIKYTRDPHNHDFTDSPSLQWLKKNKM